MEPNASDPPQEKYYNSIPAEYLLSTEHEEAVNKTCKQHKYIKKEIINYIKHPLENDNNFDDEMYYIYKGKYRIPLQPNEDLGQAPSLTQSTKRGAQNNNPQTVNQPTEPKRSFPPKLKENVFDVPTSELDTNKLKAYTNLDNDRPNLEKEQVHKNVTHPETHIYMKDSHTPSRGNYSEKPALIFDNVSSMICKAINYNKEPVIINDKVVRDKLILSCQPRKYKAKHYSEKPLVAESPIQYTKYITSNLQDMADAPNITGTNKEYIYTKTRKSIQPETSTFTKESPDFTKFQVTPIRESGYKEECKTRNHPKQPSVEGIQRVINYFPSDSKRANVDRLKTITTNKTHQRKETRKPIHTKTNAFNQERPDYRKYSVSPTRKSEYKEDYKTTNYLEQSTMYDPEQITKQVDSNFEGDIDYSNSKRIAVAEHEYLKSEEPIYAKTSDFYHERPDFEKYSSISARSKYEKQHKTTNYLKQSFIGPVKVNKYLATNLQSNIDSLTRTTSTEFLKGTPEKLDHQTTSAFNQEQIGLGEYLVAPTRCEFEERYRARKYRKYTRNFKILHWALFIISSLLLLVGLNVLLITLVHMLFNHYINIVLAQNGFVIWVWTALTLSLIILFVAVHGILTSTTRSPKTLISYCIVAVILAVVIMIFLILFWLKYKILKIIQQESMLSTLHIYRCNRWIRNAWDTLQEKYQCCGVETLKDWKYIPPSCCYAHSKYQKLACINHVIKENQAFRTGCKTKLEDYFNSTFLFISFSLLLAIILLLLDILAALGLLNLHKRLKFFKDIHCVAS